jgi:hypothetical protein
VVTAQRPLAVGEVPLVQRDRLSRLTPHPKCRRTRQAHVLVHALRQPIRRPGEPLTAPYSRLHETPLENRARREKRKKPAFRKVGCQKTQDHPG